MVVRYHWEFLSSFFFFFWGNFRKQEGAITASECHFQKWIWRLIENMIFLLLEFKWFLNNNSLEILNSAIAVWQLCGFPVLAFMHNKKKKKSLQGNPKLRHHQDDWEGENPTNSSWLGPHLCVDLLPSLSVKMFWGTTIQVEEHNSWVMLLCYE